MKKGIGCLVVFLVLASPVIAPLVHAIYLEKKAARMGRHLDGLSENEWREVFMSAKEFHANRWSTSEAGRKRVSDAELSPALRMLGFKSASLDEVGLSFMFGGGVMQGGASVSIYLKPKNNDPPHIIFRGWQRSGIAYLEGK